MIITSSTETTDKYAERANAALGPLTPLAQLMWRIPGLSERVAARLFLTPFGKLHPKERELPRAPGYSVMVRFREGIRTVVYGRGRPVFLVHGWGGEGVQMSGFVDQLVAHGYQAVAIDLPAHGESPGRTTNVLECSEALLAVQRRFGAPLGVIAHSFGAAAVGLAQRRGLRSDANVFIAPLPSLDYGMQQFASRAKLPLPVLERATALIESSVGLDRSSMDLSENGKHLSTPLLIAHDRDDGVIDIDAARRAVKDWPECRFYVTEGLGHRRILRDEGLHERAAAFLRQGQLERATDLEWALPA